jgi:hypothetical protein
MHLPFQTISSKSPYRFKAKFFAWFNILSSYVLERQIFKVIISLFVLLYPPGYSVAAQDMISVDEKNIHLKKNLALA